MIDHLYGVVGCPLGHSLSPLAHNAGFQELGIPAAYLRWEIAPERLPAFLDSMRLLDIRGCSVTIPHKTTVLPLLDEISDKAAAVGAVNTLYWQGQALCGENTDITGFLAPLTQTPLEAMDVLLLGAGGAARAVAAGLAQRRTRRVFAVTPSNRTHLPLAEHFGLTPVPWEERHAVPAHLVVNTTPLGMRGKHEGDTPYDFSRAARPPDNMPRMAYDIVYNPLETRFLREARLDGRQSVSGLEMFFSQADAQFRLWTGQGLPDSVHGLLKRHFDKFL
ncbi:MAG: shikimate dehydrogenase [Desulfovibrio sp.]|jgi:shikimate dehydrogenase|nr:shikimate dehydrogenase [Desulfovibrio sp.]